MAIIPMQILQRIAPIIIVGRLPHLSIYNSFKVEFKYTPINKLTKKMAGIVANKLIDPLKPFAKKDE